MKKILALVLSLVMIFALCACGKPAADNPLNLVSPGKLTVAISPDFAPMEFVDTSKEGQDMYVGFDVSLSKFIAEELGLELVIKPMDFSACQAAVATGAVDISISGYSYTEERAENFLLSDIYYAGDNETEQTIIVPAEKAGTYATAQDFAGLTIAAQAASLQYNLCAAQLIDAGVDCTIKEFTDIGTAVEALRNGNVDAVAVAKGNGDAIIASNPAIGFSGFMFEVSEAEENNLCLLNKDNTALLEAVNAALAKALGAGYYGPWYDEAKALAGIESAAEISYDEEGNALS